MSHSVLLIGVDAGTYRAIDRLTDQGELPTLSRLLDTGACGVLESSIPPWTPTAWTSLCSGKKAGKHGIFDFKTTDQFRLVNSGDVQTKRIWDYVSDAGGKSIVLNVPVTHPAPDIDGVLVPGYLGPEVDEAVAEPSGIVEELRDNIGDYRVYKSGGNLTDDELCEEYCRLMQMRVDAATYLCETYEWDFTMVQFQRTDTVFHELPNQEYINQVYRQLDDGIGALMRDIDADVTMIVSDHGMGPLGDWDFRLNTWLRDQGYLQTAVDGYQPGWDKPKSDDRADVSLPERTFQFIAERGFSAQDIERVFERLGIASAVKAAAPRSLLRSAVSGGSEKIDRENSDAYCPSGPGLGIYCDEAVVSDLVAELRELRDPESQPVFEWVEPAEEIFDGPVTADGPDVLVMPRDMDYYISATLSTTAFEHSQYEYNHERDGICLVAGTGVAPVETRLDITDVAPTVLALLGINLDTAFDGTVPGEIFPELSVPDERTYDSTGRETTDESYDDVESRLEDLGYFS